MRRGINNRRLFIAACEAALILAGLSGIVLARQVDGFNQAVNLFKKGDHAEAAKQFAAVVAADPLRVEANLYLGKSLVNLARFAEAETALRRYVEALPAADEGLYLLAYVLFREGRAKESLEIYARAIRIKQPASDDLKVIGLNYGLLGYFQYSAQFLGKAVEADPANIEARYYLGRVRFEQNLFADAIREFQEVLARDPHHVKAQNNLGQAFEAQNRIEEAIDAYGRAIDMQRDSPRPSELPLLNLGALLLQKDQVDEALALLVRAASINSQSAKVRFQLGKTYLRLSRLGDAEREFLQATRLDPKDVGAHYQLGRLYQRMGRTELARKEMEMSERLSAGERSSKAKDPR
jgi:tetratricopeptide (TPR) repeat protein